MHNMNVSTGSLLHKRKAYLPTGILYSLAYFVNQIRYLKIILDQQEIFIYTLLQVKCHNELCSVFTCITHTSHVFLIYDKFYVKSY